MVATRGRLQRREKRGRKEKNEREERDGADMWGHCHVASIHVGETGAT
jgi:hypothetical protein